MKKKEIKDCVVICGILLLIGLGAGVLTVMFFGVVLRPLILHNDSVATDTVANDMLLVKAAAEGFSSSRNGSSNLPCDL